MTKEKFKRLDELTSKPYLQKASQEWDEELALECELQDHPNYKGYQEQ